MMNLVAHNSIEPGRRTRTIPDAGNASVKETSVSVTVVFETDWPVFSLSFSGGYVIEGPKKRVAELAILSNSGLTILTGEPFSLPDVLEP